MIHLEKVDHRNVWDIIELAPFESQYPFVASNDESLMEAYIAITSEDAYAYPFGIYNDDTLVGFLMIGHNEAGIEPDAPESLRIIRAKATAGKPCAARWSSSGHSPVGKRNTASFPTSPEMRWQRSCTPHSVLWKTGRWTAMRSSRF